MRIAYVYPYLVHWGGVERILIEKMNLLSQGEDDEIFAVTYNQSSHQIPYHLDPKVHFIDLNVRTHVRYNYRGLRRLWEGLKRHRMLHRRLKDCLAEIRPDIIIATTSSELSLLNKLKGNIPLIVESHDGYEHIGHSSTMTWLHRWNVRRRYRQLHKADVIISLTESDAEKWRKHYPQVRVIPNVVHLNPTNQLSDVNQRRVIFVARLAEQKGIPEMMAIWRITHQRHPDWVLDMYGEGDHAYMSKMAPGMRAFPPVANIYSKYLESSVLVLTSRWEPFGLVLPEAMSCGLPVISFEGDGPCSIITDGEDGFIIRNRDIGAFSNRLCQLIEHEELRCKMGKKAIVSAQRYAPERIMPLWHQLFAELLNGQNATT